MKYYDYIEYINPDSKYMDLHTGEYLPINLNPLVTASQRASKKERMKPHSRDDMIGYPLGRVAVGVVSYPRGTEIHDALAFAGVTGFDNYEGDRLAIVGAVVTKPSARGAGLGFYTVESLLEIAQTPDAIDQYGHVGFKAVCNEASQGLFIKHGFETASIQDEKRIMIKMLSREAINNSGVSSLYAEIIPKI